MKTQPIDFILSTLALILLGFVDWVIVFCLLDGITASLFGRYDIIANTLLALLVFGLLCALSAKLLLKIKPMPAGNHDMTGEVFTWWKLFTVIYEFGRGALLPFTTVFAKPLVAKLFGASIGSDIALGGHLVDPQLITIGDEAIIGQGSVVSAHTITSGVLILSPVIIGRGATVGVNAVVMSGVNLGEGSVVTGGSVVPPNTVIPANELWGGSPVKKIKNL